MALLGLHKDKPSLSLPAWGCLGCHLLYPGTQYGMVKKKKIQRKLGVVLPKKSYFSFLLSWDFTELFLSWETTNLFNVEKKNRTCSLIHTDLICYARTWWRVKVSVNMFCFKFWCIPLLFLNHWSDWFLGISNACRGILICLSITPHGSKRWQSLATLRCKADQHVKNQATESELNWQLFRSCCTLTA